MDKYVVVMSDIIRYINILDQYLSTHTQQKLLLYRFQNYGT